MSKCKVSVILPTYNRSDFILDSILSVLEQSFGNFEIIVVDDGSDDNTESVVNSIDDDRVRYIKNEQNIGIVRSLNRGIDLAEGEYIARIDDQDKWIDEYKLEKQVDFLKSHPDHVLVGTGGIVNDINNNELFRYTKPQNDKKIRENILLKNCFIHVSTIFRKRAFWEAGGYDESEQFVEDYGLWLRMGAVGKMANIQTYSVSYISDSDGISTQKKVQQFKKNFKLIRGHKKNYPNYLKGLFRNSIRLVIYGYLDFKFLRSLTSKFNKSFS
jgi:glycosyltransferase involved in cell wall biosynthesis